MKKPKLPLRIEEASGAIVDRNDAPLLLVEKEWVVAAIEFFGPALKALLSWYIDPGCKCGTCKGARRAIAIAKKIDSTTKSK